MTLQLFREHQRFEIALLIARSLKLCQQVTRSLKHVGKRVSLNHYAGKPVSGSCTMPLFGKCERICAVSDVINADVA